MVLNELLLEGFILANFEKAVEQVSYINYIGIKKIIQIFYESISYNFYDIFFTIK